MLKRGKPPVHPGRILRNMYLEPLELTVVEAARGLGISRNALSAILNERAGISPAMAVKLSGAFGTSAELWNNMQKTTICGTPNKRFHLMALPAFIQHKDRRKSRAHESD